MPTSHMAPHALKQLHQQAASALSRVRMLLHMATCVAVLLSPTAGVHAASSPVDQTQSAPQQSPISPRIKSDGQAASSVLQTMNATAQPSVLQLSELTDNELMQHWAKHIRKHAEQGEQIDCATEMGWLQEYAAWHAEAIQEPDTAKFVVYVCGKGIVGHVGYALCDGLGDRMRGIAEALRLAVATKRVLLIGWSQPMALETFFVPRTKGPSIDWRVKPQYRLTDEKSVLEAINLRLPFIKTMPGELTAGRVEHEQRRVIALETNWLDNGKDVIPGPFVGLDDSPERGCVFDALFEPAPALGDHIQAARRELLGSDTIPYVAAHVRLGGMLTEARIEDRFEGTGKLEGFLSALTCARVMADQQGITSPIVVLTDHVLLRTQIAAGYFAAAGVVGPKSAAVHISKDPSHNTETHMTTFVDVGLLAQATCLVSSLSGFSELAMNWGRHRCVTTIEQCAKGFKRSFNHEVKAAGLPGGNHHSSRHALSSSRLLRRMLQAAGRRLNSTRAF